MDRYDIASLSCYLSSEFNPKHDFDYREGLSGRIFGLGSFNLT